MPTEINHTTIEQAIEALLKADSNVFDAASTDGTKLIRIEEGLPLFSDVTQILPGAFITLESEAFRNLGTLASNTITSFQHDIRYKIRIAVAGSGVKSTEEILNSLQKEILEVIEANNKLSDTVDSCFPESVQRVKEDDKQIIFARDIIIHCVKTSN